MHLCVLLKIYVVYIDYDNVPGVIGSINIRLKGVNV